MHPVTHGVWCMCRGQVRQQAGVAQQPVSSAATGRAGRSADRPSMLTALMISDWIGLSRVKRLNIRTAHGASLHAQSKDLRAQLRRRQAPSVRASLPAFHPSHAARLSPLLACASVRACVRACVRGWVGGWRRWARRGGEGVCVCVCVSWGDTHDELLRVHLLHIVRREIGEAELIRVHIDKVWKRNPSKLVPAQASGCVRTGPFRPHCSRTTQPVLLVGVSARNTGYDDGTDCHAAHLVRSG